MFEFSLSRRSDEFLRHHSKRFILVNEGIRDSEENLREPRFIRWRPRDPLGSLGGLKHPPKRGRHHDLGRLRIGAKGREDLIAPLPRAEVEIDKEHFSPAKHASHATRA